MLVWLWLVCIGRGRIGAGCIFGLAIGIAFCALLVGFLWTAATAVVVSPLFVALRLVLRCFSLVLLCRSVAFAVGAVKVVISQCGKMFVVLCAEHDVVQCERWHNACGGV